MTQMPGAAWTLGCLALSAAVTFGLIVLLKPLLQRYALARPNARSSHTIPTPQGGGIAIVAATLGTALAAVLLLQGQVPHWIMALAAAATLLAAVGAIDDIRPLPVAPRLLLQILAIGIAIFSLPDDLRIAPFVAPAIERALLVVAVLWFVNLTNFMDGLDWLTVAEVLPVTASLAILGLAAGLLPAAAVLLAVALFGAMLGFAPFNKPIARLFLGDVGSLPLGLLLAVLLIFLAASGHIVAAILLPLYYLADATLTLLRRMRAGEQFWQAHRSHFYQRATANGFTVREVVARVFILNLALAGLAFVSVILQSWAIRLAMLAIGIALVSLLLRNFARPR